jgi:hypothetical protein
VTEEEREAYRLEAMRAEALEVLGSLFRVVADPAPAQDTDAGDLSG